MLTLPPTPAEPCVKYRPFFSSLLGTRAADAVMVVVMVVVVVAGVVLAVVVILGVFHDCSEFIISC